MIVEKSAFDTHSTTTTAATTLDRGLGDGIKQKQQKKRGPGTQRGRHPGHIAKGPTNHTSTDRPKRGTHSGKNDTIICHEEAEDIPADAPGEGLYAYIQTTRCRRVVLQKVFGNSIPSTL